jgi:hypothetical protein
MIAKTINQANHCFSFPTTPSNKTQKKAINNEQIIFIPEMANAVTHHIKLRYKIKWMLPTANEINRLYNTNTIRFIHR